MRKIIATYLRPFLLLVLLVSAISAQQVRTKTLAGKVVGIADGDTITVLDSASRQQRVRFQGIDAPESKQAFGQRSKQGLSAMVFGKPVTVLYEELDRYGRIVGKVLVDGNDLNLEQLRAGMAWFYRFYEKELSKGDRLAYDAAEAEARTPCKGFWQDPAPVAPWDFRHPGQEASDAPVKTTPTPGIPNTGSGLIDGNKRSMIYHSAKPLILLTHTT